MSDSNIAVLTEAKTEYTKQLIAILCTNIHQGIKSIYNDAKLICEQKKAVDDILIVFQELLSRIPKWSQEIIDKEYSRVEETSQCDWLEDLITAVFISHTKVLTLAHHGKQNKKINIKIPKPSHFMHLCYIEAARGIWRDPYLFSERVPQYQIQKNMRESETIISEAISETIRKLLPVKNILKEYLGDSYNSEVSEEEDIKVQTSSKQKRNLKKLVKKELEKTLEDLENNGSDDGSEDGSTTDGSTTDGTTTDATTTDDDDDDDDPISRKKLIKKLIKKELRKNKVVSGGGDILTAASASASASESESEIADNASQSEISDIELDDIDISSIPLTVSAPIIPRIPSIPVSPITTPVESEKPKSPVVKETPVESIESTIAVVAAAAEAEAAVESVASITVNEVKQEYKDVNDQPIDSDVKAINIGSKVISGIKDFLGFNSNETKIVKLDSNNNISQPAPAPTPVQQQVEVVQKTDNIQSKQNNLNIQSLDEFDFDIDIEPGTDVEAVGSDLELDCTDIDLDATASSSSNTNKKAFTFF
jgi:hypothetical protein